MIAEALNKLGYTEFYVIGNTYEGIHWVVKPKTIPTKEEVMAMVEQLPTLKEAEQQAKEATKQSALAKLAALGLTEDEAKAIMGVN